MELPEKPNRGYELLQGSAVFSGKILGGCLDTIFDIFDGERYENSPELCSKYQLFPSKNEWKGKILLLETSEEKMIPFGIEATVEVEKQRISFQAE